MSLINDALKRAKKTQKENPTPTPPLQFRPVEPAQEGRPRAPLLIITAALAALALVAMGGLLIWVFAQQREANLQAQARTVEEAAPVAPLNKPTTTTNLASIPSTEGQTNGLPAGETVEPPKPELKLQGIFFNPKNPSAVVNGRTVYVGDRVSGFGVLAVTPHSVTLGNATQTNVLSLSE
jgi:hypothetical protein